MKKLLSLCLALCFVLCSCASLNTKPATLQKSMEIPEDGIISADIFAELKDNNEICVFSGESNSVRYEWVVFGSELSTISSHNLKVEVIRETAESVSFRIFDHFDFSPKLSLYLNNKWNTDTATVVYENTKAVSATLTAEENSILNVSVEKQGTYYAEAQSADTGSGSGEGQSQSGGAPAKGTEAKDNTGGYSDGSATGQDQYHTDPVPEGKPLPVDQNSSSQKESTTPQKQLYCTLSIECSSILNHIDDLNKEKLDILPNDGVILESTSISFSEGESVYDVLSRTCENFGIHMEASFTPMYNSYYIEGIGNLYEFDCGSGSGWMYRVNGWYPNYGCSRYALKDGDVIEFRYTCDLGNDIGGGYIAD